MMIAMRRLDKLWERYQTQVYEYCKEQFEEYVKPYCVRHSCRFNTGNGTFYLSNWGKLWNDELDEVIAEEEHPLFDILCEDIPGMPGNNVGSLMPEYNP